MTLTPSSTILISTIRSRRFRAGHFYKALKIDPEFENVKKNIGEVFRLQQYRNVIIPDQPQKSLEE